MAMAMDVLSLSYENPAMEDIELDENNVPDTNGTSTVSNGTATVSNGTSTVTNGTATVSNGTAAVSNGTAAVSNGTAAVSNGTKSVSDCIVVDVDHKDGSSKVIGQYNPYAHRSVKHPTSFMETFLHLMKASLGTGILAMPSAFRNAGYLIGIIGTIIAGCLCTYTIHLLLMSSYRLCVKRRVPCMSYPATAAAAFEEGPKRLRKFGNLASLCTKAFLVMYQVGTNCVYIVFISTNLRSVYDLFFDFPLDDQYFTLCLFPFMYALVMVKNLKLLSPFSMIGNGVTSASLVGIFYYILRKPLTFVGKEPVGSMSSIPLFFGTVLFAMEAIGVILPLENEMKHPKRFGSRFGVLNVSMVPISILYMSVGLAGYLQFGESTNTNGITLDLPQKEFGVMAIKMGLCFSVAISYALSNYVAYDVILTEITTLRNTTNDENNMTKLIIRTVLVVITFVLAMVIPNLDGLITLIGAFCLSSVGIAFPAIINQLTFYRDYQEQGKMALFMFSVRNFVIVIIAIFACIIGVYSSINSIIHHEK